MRRVARKCLVTGAVTSGVLAAAAGFAHADSAAGGAAAESPGVLTGNSVQLPVTVPVNVCGNTVDVVGLLNPVAGNHCANDSHSHKKSSRSSAPGGAAAHGKAKDSPGVVSGNKVQLPVDVPVNVSGNSVNVVGIGNPAVGNSSSNDSGHPDKPRSPKPPTAHHPTAPDEPGRSQTIRTTPPKATETLARTGTDMTTFAVPASAGLLLGGLLLHRRFRPAKP
jgi:hypothetical protein